MQFIKYTPIVFSIVSMSCQETEETNDTSTAPAPLCASLSTEECATSGCSVISAAQITVDEEINCYEKGEESPVGCQDIDVGCTNEATFASAGDGNCMFFANGCIPEGWSTCQSLATLQSCDDVKACGELAPSVCDGREDCVVISASPLTLDAASECYVAGEVEPTGCMDAGTGCTGGITFAGTTDSAEECMMFYNGCIPEGWVLCESLNSYAACTEE